MEIGRAHRSYSQFQQFTSCGKKYELTRIHKAPSSPSWWLVGGKAVHGVLEDFQHHLLVTEGR